MSALLDQQQYETLSKIAPTLVEPAEYVGFGMPWQEITRTLGRALGRSERAEAAVAEVESDFARVRAEHPEFAGRSAIAAYDFGPASFGVYGPQDPRARFLTALGFQLPKAVTDLIADQFFAEVSDEQIGLLSSDVLVWIVFLEDGVNSRLDGNPLYPTLDVVKQGRDVFLHQDDLLQAAYGFSTVPSSMRQITFGGGDLAQFVPVGPDQFIYVMIPPHGRTTLTVGRDFSWEKFRRVAGERPAAGRQPHGAPMVPGTTGARHAARPRRWDDGLGGTAYAWGGAESRAMTSVRRHLRREVGLAPDAVSMVGYWRSSPEAQPP